MDTGEHRHRNRAGVVRGLEIEGSVTDDHDASHVDDGNRFHRMKDQIRRRPSPWNVIAGNVRVEESPPVQPVENGISQLSIKTGNCRGSYAVVAERANGFGRSRNRLQPCQVLVLENASEVLKYRLDKSFVWTVLLPFNKSPDDLALGSAFPLAQLFARNLYCILVESRMERGGHLVMVLNECSGDVENH